MFKFYHLVIFLSALILNMPSCGASVEYQEQLIRVGISTSDFKYLEYSSTQITADKNYSITDLSSEKVLVNALPGSIYRIIATPNGFNINAGGVNLFCDISGPLEINSAGGHIKLVDIKRKGKTPAYRGKIQIVKSTKTSNKLSVVNILPLDEYLKGVVPNELPPSFGLEAVKAQAVAARNYAIRPREKPYSQFDICDSVACQVYFGYYTEHPLSNKAVDETAGLLVLHNGEVITALYSSAPGGFSENYENAFSDPVTNKFPAGPLPYLRGKHDYQQVNDLSTDEAAEKFYTTSPSSYDVKSGYYRWNRTWSRGELENVLNANLSKVPANFIKPAFKAGSSIGTLKNIKVLKRGVSGKAMEIEITAANGSWVVQKELLIRRLLTKNGAALPSANIIFKQAFDGSGNLITINLYGGGFGHGVGMSQYGASFMAKEGYSYDKILQHYYSNTAIGTEPVILFADKSSIPIKQIFYAPKGTGVLWIDNEGVSGIHVSINDTDLKLDEIAKEGSFKKMDISSYIIDGKNEIIYYPPTSDEEEGLSVKMWIEVVKAKL